MLYMITHKHMHHLDIQAVTEVIIALYEKHQKKKKPNSNATLKISSSDF